MPFKSYLIILMQIFQQIKSPAAVSVFDDYKTVNLNPNLLHPMKEMVDQINKYSVGKPFPDDLMLVDSRINHFYQNINLNFTQNAITYNKIIDPISGATVSKPINTNGNISAWGWMGMGSKLKKLDMQ